MQPPEDVARDLARQRPKKAASDLLVCEQLTRPEGAFSEAVAFHAQQAAEKSLKALLVWRQVEFPKTHDLERLLELAGEGDEALAESLRDAPELTPYGVEYRYPGEYPPVTGQAAASSVAIARTVYDEVVERLPEGVRL
jgi:HEPN domain-containing protein